MPRRADIWIDVQSRGLSDAVDRGRCKSPMARLTKDIVLGIEMAEIVAFPTDAARASNRDFDNESEGDRFLLDEGLELLADYRAIADADVRASMRALMRSLARRRPGPASH